MGLHPAFSLAVTSKRSMKEKENIKDNKKDLFPAKDIHQNDGWLAVIEKVALTCL